MASDDRDPRALRADVAPSAHRVSQVRQGQQVPAVNPARGAWLGELELQGQRARLVVPAATAVPVPLALQAAPAAQDPRARPGDVVLGVCAGLLVRRVRGVCEDGEGSRVEASRDGVGLAAREGRAVARGGQDPAVSRARASVAPPARRCDGGASSSVHCDGCVARSGGPRSSSRSSVPSADFARSNLCANSRRNRPRDAPR
mmetsp:Transcript_37393/g.81018  ORF Transcript_37393/g.81018 Transcript_37393/m.81018 type:complete len:202 (-) Transcript_37393:407-1012(-)